MYTITYAILYLLSLLPLGVLYFLSDCFYLCVYYLVGYRKKVVMANLQIAFPEKTLDERRRIAKDFYRHFIDSMVETIKLLSAPDSFFQKRFTGNWSLVDAYFDSGRSVQLHLGHNFNWEWGNVALQKNIRFRALGVYMPIENRVFDRLFKKIRTRSGVVMLNAVRLSRDFLPFAKTQYCLGLVADQSPGRLHKALWVDFFRRKTAFTAGPAKNAIRHNAVVIFAYIQRRGRGRYQVHFSLADENPQHTTVEALTQKFVTYLEGVIRQYPAGWLWSHRRWKHQWKAPEINTDA